MLRRHLPAFRARRSSGSRLRLIRDTELPLIEVQVDREFRPASGGAANQAAPPALRREHGAANELALA